MTTTLRIVNLVINSSSSIDVTFTENLTNTLIPSNVSILSQTENVPDSNVLQVSVAGNVLSIVCQPLTPYASYYLQFQSVPNSIFESVNGDAVISNDGVSNRLLITGPLSSDNPVYDYLQSFYQNNIYRASDTTTVINQYLQAIAVNFARALYDINQLKNENYLSFTVVDELHTRGDGPFDRLFEEASYDVFRVGLGPTLSPVSTNFVFSDFPSYPVTLQRQIVTETITTSSTNADGTFNINTLTFNLSNKPVTRVDSIVFTLTTTSPNYVYNIQDLGYQILNSRYDQDFASSYLLLLDNQIKLNEAILQDPNFSLDQIFNITIQYEYKGLGIQVDPNSVDVFTTLQSIREVIPPIVNVFNLHHAPITDSNNNVLITGGITFTNPNSTTGTPHPAFISEIPFSLSAPPSMPGFYSIDYPNGTVYVYGADTTNDGTGPYPPLATYYYQFTYTSEIDYVYDSDLLDIVALPLGNLINSAGTINFDYEQVLIPGVDYNADTHIEVINENIGNNLNALNELTTQNSPITNVFQIYNETSGEIYILDRWNGNKVYFKFNNPPRILQRVGENSTFSTIPNESLGINTTSTNSNSLKIFSINLANNTIINSTQDGIGSSFNTSLFFSNGNVFISEIWYNQEFDVLTNINKLSFIGEYTVDYKNGIVYVAVSNTQNNDIGTVTYKIDSIVTQFPNIISVDNIYYRISVLNPKNKQFSYVSFTDTNIIVQGLDVSDEAYLNGVITSPYQIYQNMVGAFIDASFVAGVTNEIKFVRSVFEYNDLSNSINPINFASVSSSSNFNITVGSINKQSFESVQFDGSNYFVILNENIPYLSPGIQFTFNVVRTSDSQSLWNSSGIVVPGNPLKLILPGIGSPQADNSVIVTYSFSIIPLERVVVDYNKGNFYVDYTYLADQILVSYEYGDNVIDFRQNTNLPTGSTYYVSYKVGALRDSLLKNFGTLVNVPDLSTFDLSLDRERYREALQAALSSFIQGPTINAIKNIGQIITHIEPQVIESTFQIWSLGSNLLSPVRIETTGSFQLLPAHFGNGALVDQKDQTITMPINSNLRLEEGTFETWILPQWNGLDNDADLIFNIIRNGVPIDSFRVFVGGSEYHPVIDGKGYFTLNKQNNVTGHPNTNKDGVFIYYDLDKSGNFYKWSFEVIDGYVTENTSVYKIQIISNGKFYDVQPLNHIRPSNVSMFTGTNKVTLNISPIMDGYGIDEGITFISDLEHYILDFGSEKDASRLSIYKDASGYMNLRVFNKEHKMYSISADVSSWKLNTPHMVAASWKLNTSYNRDEIHLFIDGLEVPNIIKYGQRLQPYLHEKFRTISEEEIVGLSSRDIIGSDDLSTTAGSAIVSSSINFSQYNIFVGDTIFINESSFSKHGYIIEAINGQSLTLNSMMPVTLTNLLFSINETKYYVSSDINTVPNIAVSTIHTFIVGNDLVTSSISNIVTSAETNFSNAGVKPGFLLRIDNPSFSLTYNIINVDGNSLTIDSLSPISVSDVPFQIYSNVENEIPGIRALNPSYSISQDGYFNNILTILNDVFANDLIIIRTLGLNSRDVKKQYYVWSSQQENILKTQLPAPISLDEVSIVRIITPIVAIGPANATLIDGVFVSNNLLTSNPSNGQNGRTIQANISGTNVNFSYPVNVTINGVSSGNTITETISFSDYGTIDFINLYTSLNYVQITATPINDNKNVLAVEVREKYPITHSEFSGLVPVIRYSYYINGGYNLSGNGIDNFVTDTNNLFSYLDIGNYLVIGYPSSVAGYYKITGISIDRHSISIKPTVSSFPVPLPAFSNARYQILNTTDYRSGLQNGFFTLEAKHLPGQAYFLDQGFYELEYATYASIKFSPLNGNLYIGSDFNGKNQANSIINQPTIYSIMLTDTRIGEVVTNNERSITKDYNSLKAPTPDSNTLVLVDFNSFPFSNDANFYADSNSEHKHFRSNQSVNDNFEQSVVVLDKPIILSNAGILDARKQGSIEFWMSPLFDTSNDPNIRYYFDAYGAIIEEVISVNNVSVKISSPASQILSVTLASGDPNIDYFAGGNLEIDSQNAVQEDVISIGNAIAVVSQIILQVISVTIESDFTNKDYFADGNIGTDGKTIYLGVPLPQVNLPLIVTYQTTANGNTAINTQVIRLNKRLPAQNSKVVVTYIPSGLQGDRISIYKDLYGYINFTINASGTDYTVRAPTRWAQNTWHRVKASYKINGGLGNDEMILFLDGYQYTDVTFGGNVFYGKFPLVVGAISIGDGYSLITSITFKDPINTLYIGSDYSKNNPIFTALDNLRISNIFRPIYAPFGEPIDVNFNSNLDVAIPVTQDLYTTYLMDFNISDSIITNFATLVDRNTGAFEFTMNIFDSFGIVSSSAKVQEILESLINILKPASSMVFIKYIN